VRIGPSSKRKILFRCRCGIEKNISICLITNKDVVSCTGCYDKVFDWYVKNNEKLKSIECPIHPDDIPIGGVQAKEIIKDKVHTFKAVCPACYGTYNPRFSDIRRGKCITCGCTNSKISRPAKEIFYFIKNIGLNPELEFKINGRFFDIFIPEKRIVIEFNGLIWHSKFESKIRDYNKYLLAKEHDLNMLSIFEDEWKYKKDTIKSIIKNRLGKSNSKNIKASECEIMKIGQKYASMFYEKFHYIGKCQSDVHYCITYHNEPIGCISFKRNSTYCYELSRIVSNHDYEIYDAWNKIILNFIQEFNPETIVSFSDNRLYDGTIFSKIGFELSGEVKPDYYLVHGNKRFHKSVLTKHECEVKTEKQIMKSKGYRKIWDLGKKRWILHVNERRPGSAMQIPASSSLMLTNHRKMLET